MVRRDGVSLRPKTDPAAAVLCCLLLLCPSCSVPHQRAARKSQWDFPEHWSVAGEAGGSADLDGANDAPDGLDTPDVWWAAADDAARDLVNEALANNPDLARTGARLLQSVALAKLTTGESEIAANLGLGAGRTKTNFIGFPFVAGVPVSRTTTYGLSLDVSWEADLWGRLAAGEQAALSDVRAVAADLAGARLSLVGATLISWYGLVEASAQRALAERTLAIWDENVVLVDRRHRSGLRPALDRRTVAVHRAGAAARLTERRRLEQDAVRSLEILLGRYPAAELVAAADLPSWGGLPDAGLPAELLHRRADLAAAEARLLAAELRVDQARADFYPRLTLSGSAGTRGQHFSDVFDEDYTVWSILGGAVQPLLDGGRLQARWDVADAQAQEALSAFQGTLLVAMAEVETLLAAESWLADVEASLGIASREADAALVLARERYRSGLVDLITLLDSQRSSQLAASEWLSQRFARVRNRIELHLALGGGFDGTALGPEPGGTP